MPQREDADDWDHARALLYRAAKNGKIEKGSIRSDGTIHYRLTASGWVLGIKLAKHYGLDWAKIDDATRVAMVISGLPPPR